MSDCGADIRNIDEIKKLKEELTYKLDNMDKLFGMASIKDAGGLFRLRDTFLMQMVSIHH